jgi:hypothetical protein
MKLFIPPRRGDPTMCPLLCPECRSLVQLPEHCSHATCLSCGLILEDLPVISGEEALLDRSKASRSHRSRCPSGGGGRWQRLRALQWQIDEGGARIAKVRAHLRCLKAALDLPVLEDGILTHYTALYRAVRAKRLKFSPEALASVLFYAHAKSNGLPIDFADFSAHASLTKYQVYRLLSRLSNADLNPPQAHANAAMRRQSALGILEKLKDRLPLPPPVFTTSHALLSRRELSVIPRINVMVAILVSVHRCKAAGILSNHEFCLRPLYKALHVAPSTAYKIGHERKLLTRSIPPQRPIKDGPISAVDRRTFSEFFNQPHQVN